MASTVEREPRSARLHMALPPSKRKRWEAFAAERGITLTGLIERAMEREEEAHSRRKRVA